MTTEEIAALINDARCINSCIPQGMQLAVLIYLASQFASGGTGVQHGDGDPITNGIPATPGLLYINDTDATLWAVAGGAWHELV